jgi:hypothetical protein
LVPENVSGWQKKWRVKLKSLNRKKSKEKERKNRKEENEKKLHK